MTQPLTEQTSTLTARDLRGFDRRRVELIREMEAYGWRGRRGSKHHMIMRAPDGTTTTAISPKVISPKNEHHVAADFRRWLRQQQQQQQARESAQVAETQMVYPAADSTSVLVAFTSIRRQARPVAEIEALTVSPAPVDTAPGPVVAVLRNAQRAQPEFTCGLCERDFGGAQPLSVHRVRTHSKVACEVCDQPMSPSNLPRHLRKHVEQIGTHEEAMRQVIQLRDELTRARTEATEWERLADEIEDRYMTVKDRVDNAVGYLLGS